MTQIEIIVMSFNAHAGKNDDLTGADRAPSFASLCRCGRSKFENGAHATSSEIEPVNLTPPVLGRTLAPSDDTI
jgi:hypothetical protein